MIKQSYGKDMILCEDAEICKEDKIGVSIIYAYEDSDVCYPAKLDLLEFISIVWFYVLLSQIKP